MRVIVEIDEEIYEHARIKSEDSNDEWNAMRAIANGIPLPANPTNGDVIKAMFPDAEIFIDETVKNYKFVLVWFKDSKVSHDFNWNWWNAPYKEVNNNEVDN